MNLLASGGAMGWEVLIMYVVIIGGFMYFAAIRPQNKEKKGILW